MVDENLFSESKRVLKNRRLLVKKLFFQHERVLVIETSGRKRVLINEILSFKNKRILIITFNLHCAKCAQIRNFLACILPYLDLWYL